MVMWLTDIYQHYWKWFHACSWSGSFSISACASAPDMILGVWISTNPLLVRVSLKSWHTPDCRRKMAWLVVVFETQTHACKMAQLPHLDFFLGFVTQHKRFVKTEQIPVLKPALDIKRKNNDFHQGTMCIQTQQLEILGEKNTLMNVGIRVKPQTFHDCSIRFFFGSVLWGFDMTHLKSPTVSYNWTGWCSAQVVIHHRDSLY